MKNRPILTRGGMYNYILSDMNPATLYSYEYGLEHKNDSNLLIDIRCQRPVPPVEYPNENSYSQFYCVQSYTPYSSFHFLIILKSTIKPLI